MTKLKIGGVPEYFNLPIHLALEQGKFEKEGLNIAWITIPEGTGRMASMLDSGELDMAVILTEGITKSIIEGYKARIVKDYVISPLQWGVHVPFAENPSLPHDMSDKYVAISRYGSGSHLMSFLFAEAKGWDTSQLQFKVINNLSGALESLAAHDTHLFLWEKYTTQPKVDNQLLSRVDIQPTPWPCFVLAANVDRLTKDTAAIKKCCEIIAHSCEQTQKLPDLGEQIAQRFGLRTDQVDQICNEVRWSTATGANDALSEAIDQVITTFRQLGLVQSSPNVSDIIYQW